MKTLVVGASRNPARVSHTAIHRLAAAGHEVLAFGLRAGEVAGIEIDTDREAVSHSDIHTITLYIGPARQPDLIDWLVSLKPQRVIFNPGTENPVFMAKLREANIEVIEACTLVMLSVGNY
ncbi:MAG: CoA-binding protein [Bacteroidia bacterium]